MESGRRRRLGRNHPWSGQRRRVVTDHRTSGVVGRRRSVGDDRRPRHRHRNLRRVHRHRDPMLPRRLLDPSDVGRRRPVARSRRSRRSTFVAGRGRRHGVLGCRGPTPRHRGAVGSSPRSGRRQGFGEYREHVGLSTHFRTCAGTMTTNVREGDVDTHP